MSDCPCKENKKVVIIHKQGKFIKAYKKSYKDKKVVKEVKQINIRTRRK